MLDLSIWFPCYACTLSTGEGGLLPVQFNMAKSTVTCRETDCSHTRNLLRIRHGTSIPLHCIVSRAGLADMKVNT